MKLLFFWPEIMKVSLYHPKMLCINRNKWIMAENKKIFPVSFFNSRLISIISIALVLFLIGLFSIIGLLGQELSVYLRENISFSIYLTDGMKDSDAQQLQKKLDKLPFVKSTKYISKEMAGKEMADRLGEDPQAFLGFNPFQAEIEVRLKSGYTHTDSLLSVEKKLTSYASVSELQYEKGALQLVNSNIKQIGLVLSVLILILLLVSFVLINNTIRLLIYSKRFLIYTMRLVGATPGFIRRPFIKHNIVNGVIAGITAIFMLIETLQVQEDLLGMEMIVPWGKLWGIYGLLLIVGILLCVASACFAVNRYLNMEGGRMYYD
jgi:cell division transport system permease protein